MEKIGKSREDEEKAERRGEGAVPGCRLACLLKQCHSLNAPANPGFKSVDHAAGEHADVLEHAVLLFSICCNPDGNEALRCHAVSLKTPPLTPPFNPSIVWEKSSLAPTICCDADGIEACNRD